MAKTGLLIVTNPLLVGKIISTIKEKVKNTLYIYLPNPSNYMYPETTQPQLNNNNVPKYYQTVRVLYSKVIELCEDLDVRILLSSLKYSTVRSIKTSQPIDLVIFDRLHDKSYIDNVLNEFIQNKEPKCAVLTLANDDVGDKAAVTAAHKYGDTKQTPNAASTLYKHVVAGGTFDRLHVGHKLLLSACALGATDKVTIGVTDTNMIEGKILWELIEPIDIRLKKVEQFLNDICPELVHNIVPIQDVYGPTISDATIEAIVVSDETQRSGRKVNEVRTEKGLKSMDVVTIPLLDYCNGHAEASEETKVSSNICRMQLLGTLLKPVRKPVRFANGPYVIGLTGSIASGKSAVAGHLERLGAAIVNCDRVAHELYEKGKPLHRIVHNAFGDSVLDANGEIDRKALGAIVFHDKAKLQQLNALAWPAIATEVERRVPTLGAPVIVIEAAVLIQAGWHLLLCDEVWVCVVPPAEAIARLRQRNGFSEEEAAARLATQPPNVDHVREANVVLCTLWSTDYTRQTVERAWRLLLGRLSNKP